MRNDLLHPDVTAGVPNATEAERAFDAVCRNERFRSYRDMEPSLGVAARAVRAGWCPEAGHFDGAARRRAGYLLDLLARKMPSEPARAWAARLAALRAVQPPAEALGPFFHRDPPGDCGDDLAHAWGLTRGLNRARLDQMLRPPYVA